MDIHIIIVGIFSLRYNDMIVSFLVNLRESMVQIMREIKRRFCKYLWTKV